MNYKKNEKKETKDDIYQVFEREFGRTLSTMDYEIINAWIDGGYSEELIIAALREAVYNGVTNLRYIDRILNEWNKKGIKAPEDIKNAFDPRSAGSALSSLQFPAAVLFPIMFHNTDHNS